MSVPLRLHVIVGNYKHLAELRKMHSRRGKRSCSSLNAFTLQSNSWFAQEINGQGGYFFSAGGSSIHHVLLSLPPKFCGHFSYVLVAIAFNLWKIVQLWAKWEACASPFVLQRYIGATSWMMILSCLLFSLDYPSTNNIMSLDNVNRCEAPSHHIIILYHWEQIVTQKVLTHDWMIPFE
jgi:hypothetical protein